MVDFFQKCSKSYQKMFFYKMFLVLNSLFKDFQMIYNSTQQNIKRGVETMF